jgi:S1-C subfamily serine protease
MRETTWICAACRRRVPPLVDVCRCGRRRQETADGPAAGAPETPARARRVPLALAAAALVLVLAAAVWRERGAPAPGPERPRPGLAAAPDEPASGRAPAPDDVEAESRVPQWPDDPTLWRVDTSDSAPDRPAANSSRSFEDVMASALAAVALVESPAGNGTGFFVAPDTLVTNAHVVESHAYVRVRTSTGGSLTARVVQRHDETDLALLRTPDARAGQAVLPLASSREARIGHEVYAIGSPMGLQNTVTRGIVSALRQAGPVVLVQTDAAINPGNSGGPIIDRSGQVLAIATMRMAGRAEALGFGVGAEYAQALVDGRAPSPSRAGQRPADAFAAGGDEVDGDRASAEVQYERFLLEASRRADQLDRSWDDFVKDCLSGKPPRTRSDRGWYALWEKFDEARVSLACTRFLADFKVAAREFERRMTGAADHARRQGVYPGAARQLRAKYRLDSPDW